MTTDEKLKFIAQLMDEIKHRALSNVAKMPEEWDGIELRQYLTDLVESQAGASTYLNKRTKRYRDYQQTLYSRNLDL